MKATKIVVRLPAPALERAREAVRSGRAASISAYVSGALEEKTRLDDLAGLLDEMLAETGGPLRANEKAFGERVLRPDRRRAGSRGRR